MELTHLIIYYEICVRDSIKILHCMTRSVNDARTKFSIKANTNQRAQTNKHILYKSNLRAARNEDEIKWKRKWLQND